MPRRIINRRSKESSGFSALADEYALCKYGQGTKTLFLFSLMKTASEAINNFIGLCMNSENLAHHSDTLVEEMNFFHSVRDTAKSTVIESDCRYFSPDWSSDEWPLTWIQGDLLNQATKLSLISGGIVKLSSGSSFPKLKVALLCDNRKMRCISANIISSMEKLRVLDLNKCVSLTGIPDTIGNLGSLELLDLSRCINLISVPWSIGRLMNLKCFRMSGCSTLIHLPESLGKVSQLETLPKYLRALPQSIGFLSSL